MEDLIGDLDIWSFVYLTLLSTAAFVIYKGRFVRYIPNNRVGVVEKFFSMGGSVKQGILALNGEAGYQPWVLRGGWHIMKPFIYRIHKVPLVTIPQGKLGYVFARGMVRPCFLNKLWRRMLMRSTLKMSSIFLVMEAKRVRSERSLGKALTQSI